MLVWLVMFTKILNTYLFVLLFEKTVAGVLQLDSGIRAGLKQ